MKPKSFFNDEDEDDESFKPVNQKPLPQISNAARFSTMPAAKAADADPKAKFSKLFGDDDEEEDY